MSCRRRRSVSSVFTRPDTGAAGQGGREPDPGGRRRARWCGAPADVDFTTVQRYDAKTPPAVSATDEFFEFLFSASDVKYAELKALAEKQEPLPPFALKGVTLTINVDADYDVVRPASPATSSASSRGPMRS